MLPSILLSAVALPLALAFPSPPVKRDSNETDAQKIVDAVSNIETKIAKVNSTLTGFNQGDLDGIVKVLEIQLQTEQLGDSIKDATKAADDSAPLDQNDSATVGIAVLNLQPQIYSLLDTIVSKKPVFDTVILGVGSVSPQVEQDLQQQKGLSDDFGTALTAKLASPFNEIAPSIIADIDSHFDDAIAAYATSGGLFALPPLPSFDAFKAAVEKASKSDSSSSGGLLGVL